MILLTGFRIQAHVGSLANGYIKSVPLPLLKYWAHNPIGYTWNLEQHKFHVEASNTSALLLEVPMAIRDELGQLTFALIK